MGNKLFAIWEIFGNSWKTSYVRATWGGLRRAVLGSFAVVMFGIAILMISLFALSGPTKVYPAESIPPVIVDKAPVIVEYYLPYPGLLPDSPIYKVKAVRDRVKLLLTFNQEMKARLELFYADKRINAAWVLTDGGKHDIAVTTATKAEKYLEQSIEGAVKLQKEKKDVKSLLLTQQKAVQKHLEVLNNMSMKVDGNRKIVLETTILTTENLGERVDQALLDSN